MPTFYFNLRLFGFGWTKKFYGPAQFRLWIRKLGVLYFYPEKYGIYVNTNFAGQTTFCGRAIDISLSTKGCFWFVKKYPYENVS